MQRNSAEFTPALARVVNLRAKIGNSSSKVTARASYKALIN